MYNLKNERNMKNKLSKAYIGVCLLFAFSSCSDSFLEEKRDYNNLTTLDIATPARRRLCSLPFTSRLLNRIIHRSAARTL